MIRFGRSCRNRTVWRGRHLFTLGLMRVMRRQPRSARQKIIPACAPNAELGSILRNDSLGRSTGDTVISIRIFERVPVSRADILGVWRPVHAGGAV